MSLLVFWWFEAKLLLSELASDDGFVAHIMGSCQGHRC